MGRVPYSTNALNGIDPKLVRPIDSIPEPCCSNFRYQSPYSTAGFALAGDNSGVNRMLTWLKREMWIAIYLCETLLYSAENLSQALKCLHRHIDLSVFNIVANGEATGRREADKWHAYCLGTLFTYFSTHEMRGQTP